MWSARSYARRFCLDRLLGIRRVRRHAETQCAESVRDDEVGLPIVHSTVNVSSGQNKPTVPELAELLEDSPPIDRTTINSWEDADFVAAVRATRRRKLIFCALWTEACMAFAALDALRERYEVYPVVDAIAGSSVEAHHAGLDRVTQAGSKPTSWVSLACELQRDWARQQTVPEFGRIVFTERLSKERPGVPTAADSR
jgi:nicotinamidase-related amidase